MEFNMSNVYDKKLIARAYKIVKKNNNYSISFLQRKLGVGYTTAMELMDIILSENEDKNGGKNR